MVEFPPSDPKPVTTFNVGGRVPYLGRALQDGRAQRHQGGGQLPEVQDYGPLLRLQDANMTKTCEDEAVSVSPGDLLKAVNIVLPS